MSQDSGRQAKRGSSTDRRDVLKALAGTAAASALGAVSTVTAAAAPSMDTAFLADDVFLNLYQHDDQAVHSPDDNTTFLVYQSVDPGGSSTETDRTDGDAYAVAYDHDTGEVEPPVRIGLNPLGVGDTHGVPAMTVDGDGYIHVVFGGHGGYNVQASGEGYDHLQYARSENPYDITSWIYPPNGSSGAGPLPTPPGTYPCMTYDSGTDAVYVLYRAGNGSGGYPSHDHATLATSSDNGNSWTDINDGVLDFTDSPWDEACAYVCDLGAWHGRMHLSWQIAESDSHGQPRRNVYHAAYNPSTGNMETMSGKNLGSEVSWSQAESDCKIKDTGDIGLDDGGSSGEFNHVYDEASDTAYIPVRYPLDSSTAQLRLLSYQGVSDQSGSWEESERITTTDDPQFLNTRMRVNDSGQLEIHDQVGKNGIFRKESGSWNHYAYTEGTPNMTDIQRPVQNGTDEFGWVGREKHTQNGATHRIVYALGFDQPDDAGAAYPQAPRNLRITDVNDTTVTIDWDSGLAGPSAVDFYRVYVDGEHHKDVTTLPDNWVSWANPYPRSWTQVDLGDDGGPPPINRINVSLVNNDGTESEMSNTAVAKVHKTNNKNL